VADPFVAEIRMFCGSFAPVGWAFCNGQIIPISQNTALFALLGTRFGGDGKTTFALPDLQARFPVHQGQGPGLTLRDVGDVGGAETVTLSVSEIPAHAHRLQASAEAATSADPPAGGDGLLAATSQPVYGPLVDPVPTATTAIAAQGASQPHENRQPYLAVSFIIALQGIFPPSS
jgi:microcystin-dependent protein